MELCHCLEINKNFEVAHRIFPKDKLKTTSLILGPKRLSFYPFLLASYFVEENFLPNEKFDFDLSFSLAIQIIDDEEKKPLFKNASAGLSLLLISEFIEGINETLDIIGFELNFIDINSGSNILNIYFKPTKNSAKATLFTGAALFRCAIESLLFVRGLQIQSADISYDISCINNTDHTLMALKNIFCFI